jgi:hypothetical protein
MRPSVISLDALKARQVFVRDAAQMKIKHGDYQREAVPFRQSESVIASPDFPHYLTIGAFDLLKLPLGLFRFPF